MNFVIVLIGIASATLLNDMDMIKMLAELRSERQRLDEGILVLQRLATGGRKRRGRPPKWMSPALSAGPASIRRFRKRTVTSIRPPRKTFCANWVAVAASEGTMFFSSYPP